MELSTHNKRIDYKKKERNIFGILILFLILLVSFFKFKIHYNEMDVLPFAKAVYNSNWLSNDWYLSQSIPYRMLFSYPVGFLIDKLGFIEALTIGRLISYLLSATAIWSFIKTIKQESSASIYFLAFIAFVVFFPVGNGAGEWMFGGLETKVFAYAFALFSLNALLNNKIKTTFLFAGLALSFHLLVGLYHFISLVPIVFIIIPKKSIIKEMLHSIPYYLIAGSIGIYGILTQLFFSQSVSDLGWEIYVNVRVNHHVLPSHFPIETWIKMAIFTLFNLYIYFNFTKHFAKLLSVYALVTVAITSIGLIIFITPLPNHLLKYYLFRFSDIILPLITLFNLASYLTAKTINLSSSKLTMMKSSIIVISILLLIPKGIEFCSNFSTSENVIKARTNTDIQMAEWVLYNTQKDDTFIAPPDDKFFYVNYNRPVFALWKCSPQSNLKIIEWYNRLKLLNKGSDFTSESELRKGYNAISTWEILNIKINYPDIKYVITNVPNELGLNELYKTDKHILYTF